MSQEATRNEVELLWSLKERGNYVYGLRAQIYTMTLSLDLHKQNWFNIHCNFILGNEKELKILESTGCNMFRATVACWEEWKL